MVVVAMTLLTMRFKSLPLVLALTFSTYLLFTVSVFFMKPSDVLWAWGICTLLTVAAMILVHGLTMSRSGMRTLLFAIVGWPLQAMTLFSGSTMPSVGKQPEEVPGRLSGMVDFVEAMGDDHDHMMVFLQEYGDTPFFTTASTFDALRLEEGKQIDVYVERHSNAAIGNNQLWISGKPNQ